MKSIFINTEGVEKELTNTVLNHNELSPKTEFIAYLMNNVGVYNFYTKENILAFISRLAVVNHKNGLQESFFSNDILYQFYVGETIYTIQIEDLLDNIGLKISGPDKINNKIWMKNYLKIWENGKKSQSFFLKLKHEPTDFKIDPINKISFKNYLDAKFLTSIVNNEIDNSIFIDWSKKHQDILSFHKDVILSGRNSFHISNIPIGKIIKCREHIASSFSLEDDDDFKNQYDNKVFIELIKLAWCYQYKLVYSNEDGWPFADSVCNLDEGLFDGIDGDSGSPPLDAIYDDFSMNKMVEILEDDTY